MDIALALGHLDNQDRVRIAGGRFMKLDKRWLLKLLGVAGVTFGATPVRTLARDKVDRPKAFLMRS
jgi:hypothetical protein